MSTSLVSSLFYCVIEISVAHFIKIRLLEVQIIEINYLGSLVSLGNIFILRIISVETMKSDTTIDQFCYFYGN